MTNKEQAAAEEQALARRPGAAIEALGIPIGLVDVGDPTETAARILDEIATATSADEVFGSEVEGFREHVGEVFTLNGSYRWQPSDYPEQEGWPFAVFEAVDVAGKTHLITCGARKTSVQIATWAKLGAWPVTVRFAEIDIGDGRSVLQFDRPD